MIDQAGVDEASASFDVTVNDVAPIIALGGAAEIEAGATYTLDLGAISDPGTDSVTEYLVSWETARRRASLRAVGNPRLRFRRSPHDYGLAR